MQTKQTWVFDITLLTLGLMLLFGLFLGSYSLSVPDEARYAEIPREMLVNHNFITPYLNGIKYFEKPVLFYWLQAASLKMFGFSEWGVRFVNALMALLSCIVVYGAGRNLFDRRTGLLAGLILATSALYFGMAHGVTLDMTFTFFVSASLLSFLTATQQPVGLLKRYAYYSSYFFAALAILSKGLVGFIFPVMVIGLWILLLNQWRLLKECHLLTGLAIILVVAAPWHILVQLHNPEFLNFYFLEQHFLRYLTKTSGRNKPFWFFGAVLIGGLLPWICFLPQAIKQQLPPKMALAKQYSKQLFLLLWATSIFLFYTFSNSKLAPYLLPIFPAIALMLGQYFAKQWEAKISTGLRIGYLAIMIILGLAFFAFACATQILGLANKLPPITTQALVLLAIWSTTAFLSCYYCWRQHQPAAFRVLFYGTVAAYIIAASCMSKIDIGSIKPLTQHMQPYLKADTMVVSYNNYYQDLPYYLQRRVVIVNWKGELKFGMEHQDTQGWMLTDQQFWPLWQSQQSILMVMPKKTYLQLKQTKHYPFYLIAETAKDVLLTNHKN